MENSKNHLRSKELRIMGNLMQIFHFGLFSDPHFEEINAGIENLIPYWKSPSFKFERLVFSSVDELANFLQVNEEFLFPKESTEEIFSLAGNINLIYQIEHLLEPYSSSNQAVGINFFCENSAQELENLKIAFEDKLKDFAGSIDPKISFIHPTYQIDLTSGKKKRRRGTTKLPIEFRKLLKQISPNTENLLKASEFYGSKVFQTFTKLFVQHRLNRGSESENEVNFFSNPVEEKKAAEKITYNTELSPINLPLPKQPMKFIDFQGDQLNWIEIRFKHYLEGEFYQNIHQSLSQLIEGEKIKLLRTHFVFDAWEDGINFKKASSDSFTLTWNELELAFQQQNPEFLHQYFSGKKMQACYFRLTPKIEENDFRLELMQRLFPLHFKIVMR